MKQARILKIVVASPGDVQAERDMIPAIVDALNKGIAEERGVRTEHEIRLALESCEKMGRPQNMNVPPETHNGSA